LPVSAPSATLTRLCALLRGDATNQSDLPGWDDAGWTEIVALANRNFLAPALHAALEAAPGRAAVPFDAAWYLAMLHRLNAARNAKLRSQIEELALALNGVDIRPVLLKGAATLFAGPFADPASRMIGDVDILIEPACRDRGLAALSRIGYTAFRLYPETHNAYGDLGKSGQPGAIDLHVEPIDCSHLLSASELRLRASAIAIGSAQALVPCPTDRVFHNILHAEIHDVGGFYLGRLPLRDLHELATASAEFGGAIDWSFMRQRAREHSMTSVLQSYVLAAHRLFGGPWPFAGRQTLCAEIHFRRRLAQFRHPWLEALAVPWGNLRGAFARHRMRALYGASGGGFVLAWRFMHGIRFLSRHSLGLAASRLFRV
jgi:hypothetical protein